MGLVASGETPSFGKYTLVAKLATGGMAEIFLARLQGAAGFAKLVCVKRILPHLAADEQLVTMFLAEAKIAAQISHANVCSVYELGEIDGSYFIAMEYLEGIPFACWRRQDMYGGTIDHRLVAGLGLQACQGLHHAHQLKRSDGSLLEVVHRDVSANNLFATVDGVVKVLDFGIAKVQDASVRTTTGSVKGTYAYMAPEQLRGERIDRRADVFALGTVLWELFAKKHLFKRETDFLTFQAITSDPIPDIGEFRPDVPPALAAVIATALARDREQRFPTARAMSEALTKACAASGGPMSPGEISDEIMVAFEARLADQRELVRIARDGGTLSLKADLGPAVGHGTHLVTTPVSIISSRGEATQSDGGPPSMVSEVSQPKPATAPIAAAPRSVTMAVSPPARSRRWLVVAAPSVVVAIAIVVIVVLSGRDRAPPAGTTTAQASVQAEAVPADAMIAVTPADAAVPVIAVIDAAPPTVASVKASPPKPAGARPRAPPPPTGPNGLITIDSKPIYAVIFIDGKRYGETPLVKVSLPPGPHSVRAVSGSGSTRTFSITIPSGKAASPLRIVW